MNALSQAGGEKGATEAVALFGGVYNNHVALAALLEDIARRDITEVYCLGDLGGFGPHPDKVFPLLREAGVRTMQGNYDNSVGHDKADGQCGYTDPRDNYFARLSYQYTHRHTSPANKEWMRALPDRFEFNLGGARVRLCHGSPRRMNEFLWETTTSDAFLERLCSDCHADVIVATHTGLHWTRQLPSGRRFVNCGVIGRPANDGRTEVWYCVLNPCGARDVAVEFVPLAYDHEQLAQEMRRERLPDEFIETIETGWWTTCLEILPGKERARGKR
jgi:diadenosine tetraphosphatase ApaH/serine/threonine PP2A family protein phosphatase